MMKEKQKAREKARIEARLKYQSELSMTFHNQIDKKMTPREKAEEFVKKGVVIKEKYHRALAEIEKTGSEE